MIVRKPTLRSRRTPGRCANACRTPSLNCRHGSDRWSSFEMSMTWRIRTSLLSSASPSRRPRCVSTEPGASCENGCSPCRGKPTMSQRKNALMLCDELRPELAGVVDGTAHLDRSERRHVEHCLRCQAEVAQYRKLLRAMHNLR